MKTAAEPIRRRFAAALAEILIRTHQLVSHDWERIAAHALGGKVCPSPNYLADVVFGDTQCSVKSVKQKPIKSRDVVTSPTRSAMVVERRIQTPPDLSLIDASADEIAAAVTNDADVFEIKSLKYYECKKTIDFFVVHGRSKCGKFYGARFMVFPHRA